MGGAYIRCHIYGLDQPVQICTDDFVDLDGIVGRKN